MVTRVTTFEGAPEQIDEGVRLFTETTLPWLRDATGFRGWLALHDREHDRAIGITFWTTKEAADAGAAKGGPLRDEIAENVGALMKSLELYDVIYTDGMTFSASAG
jgi:heme-degrading monooxygenase HmoA